VAVPVVSGPLEGARATGARPDALVWLEGVEPRKSGPHEGEARARVCDGPGEGHHLYALRDGALWFAGLTDAKCAGCGSDHLRYDRRGRHDRCALCGGALVGG
jgi:hypothetical protein